MSDANQLPIIALTMGDPAGIGPEIILKTMLHADVFQQCIPVMLGDAGIMDLMLHESGLSVDINQIHNPEEALPGKLNLISLSGINLANFCFGEVRTDLGLTSTFYIIKAVEFAMARRMDAIVTCPINKASLRAAGYDYTSHSQMLRSLTNEPYTCTMLVGHNVRITRTTSHAPLSVVPRLLTFDMVLHSLRQTSLTLIDHFEIARPRLGVCALNPHAGEHGLFGSEDDDVIRPAIEAARAEGIVASDPLPADLVFARYLDGQYDAAVCMYHDQAHIAHRLVENTFGVNLTMGLPIIRTSPDHGAAYDIAGKGYASESGLLRSLELAASLAAKRKLRQRTNTLKGL
jgi:4-hydroxythreonine-4-phosphate dehydrogenase